MKDKLIRAIKALGPGFIVASVVLGPGSVTTASQIGAVHGYALLWVIVISAIGMIMYTTMAARFGVSHEKSFLQTVADTYGRWAAILIGVSSFLVAASFQFGNNLGIATSMQTLTGISEYVWPPIFNGLAILLIFFAKNLYQVLEKLMMFMVMIMITAFIVNLFFIKPDLGQAVQGFVPVIPDNSLNEVAAIVATTFVLHAALYQSYLVQNKGWTLKDMKSGMRDSIAGIIVLASISALIILNSAAALKPAGITISTAGDMAIQLEALFGSASKIIFSFGLWAAAYSSFTVNSIIAGGLLSDGLGLGRTMQEKWPKIFTVLALLVGMMVATFFRGNIVYALVLAQASSLLAVPAVAIGLFVILNNKNVMGKYANTWKQNVVAIFGMILIFIMVYFMWHRLISTIGRAF
ncbi:divalent metal cation transporter [candidate division KSB1 bacterium]|nr:divalent metal cation transporter [candidate division KSB1 bacterium]